MWEEGLLPTIEGFEAIAKPPEWSRTSFVAIFGDEPFLKRLVLDSLNRAAAEEGGIPPSIFHGQEVSWADVIDELSTRSLFGDGEKRFVVIDPADGFVSQHRERLEREAERTGTQGSLVLVLESWPSNTRLYKIADRVGLQIDCRLPQRAKGKGIDESRVVSWLVRWAADRHGLVVRQDAAAELLGLANQSLGSVDQELGKLVLYERPQRDVTIEDVRRIVGGWRQHTIWEIVDAAMDGQVAQALEQLDHLLASGEAAQGLFGQLSWSLRRYAVAADRIRAAERARRTTSLEPILKEAGFREWPRDEMEKTKRRLQQLGGARAKLLHRWLLETDLAIKGSHSHPARTRVALERLFLQLASGGVTSR